MVKIWGSKQMKKSPCISILEKDQMIRKPKMITLMDLFFEIKFINYYLFYLEENLKYFIFIHIYNSEI